jgi:peptidoglycan hydrolase-like protein with peptidoglycan-binding domain
MRGSPGCPWRPWVFFGFVAVFAMTGEFASGAPKATPPAAAAAAAADQVFESQKSAFDALPETDRRSIQDALVWTGDYNGIVDGSFGKRTRDSILAYQASVKSPTTGVMDPAEIAGLVAAAQKAKTAAKFQIFVEDKTGIKIGAPLKWLDKRIPIATGARLMKGDGTITLDLSNSPGADLGALYARLSADAPGRKTTLKLSRPDFFVVSGEDSGRKFYSRYAKAPESWPDPTVVRGFTLAYPAQLAEFDRLTLAIANSFEPFVLPAVAAPAAKSEPASPPTPTSALTASGYVVAPGQALTAINSVDCPHPTIDGRPTKFVREDKQSGLSVLETSPVGAPAGTLMLSPLGDDLVALTYVAAADGKPRLEVVAASVLAGAAETGRPQVLASLTPSAIGSPVFDRKGALVAVVAGSAADGKRVQGVAALAPHRVIAAPDIERFLVGYSIAPTRSGDEAESAGRIVAEKRDLVVSILCN